MMVATAPLFPLIVIGIMLTTAGIYGVLAFAIARRSRELAVRIAVGAERRRRREADNDADRAARIAPARSLACS